MATLFRLLIKDDKVKCLHSQVCFRWTMAQILNREPVSLRLVPLKLCVLDLQPFSSTYTKDLMFAWRVIFGFYGISIVDSCRVCFVIFMCRTFSFCDYFECPETAVYIMIKERRCVMYFFLRSSFHVFFNQISDVLC